MTQEEIATSIMSTSLDTRMDIARAILQSLPAEIKPDQQMDIDQATVISLFSKIGVSVDVTPDDTFKICDWAFYKKIIPYLAHLTSVTYIPQDINFFDCDKRAFLFCSLISYLYHINGQAKAQGVVTYQGNSNGHAWVNVVALDEKGVRQVYFVDPYFGAYVDAPMTSLSQNINQTYYVQSGVVRFI